MTRLHVPIGLRWNDLDAYGHVNNAAMLTLLEESRISVFWGGDGFGVEGLSDIAFGLGGDTITLIARQEVEYLAPIPYLREPVDIQLWIGRLGGASIEVCYEVCSPVGVDPVVVFARAASTIVLVDTVSQKPRRMTEREREAWSAFIDDPIVFAKRS